MGKSKLSERIRSWWYSPVNAIFFAIICLYLLKNIISLISVYQKQDDLMALATKDLNKMKEKVLIAEKRSGEIMTDRGMEAYIKDVYPVVGAGEKVIVIQEGKKDVVAAVKSTATFEEQVIQYIQHFLGR